MSDLRQQLADELARHCDTMSWSGNDADPITVTLGCRCGHERATVTAAELAADHAGYLRQHRLHVADALLAVLEASHNPLSRPVSSPATRTHLVRSTTAERRSEVTTRQGIATHGEQSTTEDE